MSEGKITNEIKMRLRKDFINEILFGQNKFFFEFLNTFKLIEISIDYGIPVSEIKDTINLFLENQQTQDSLLNYMMNYIPKSKSKQELEYESKCRKIVQANKILHNTSSKFPTPLIVQKNKLKDFFVRIICDNKIDDINLVCEIINKYSININSPFNTIVAFMTNPILDSKANSLINSRNSSHHEFHNIIPIQEMPLREFGNERECLM